MWANVPSEAMSAIDDIISEAERERDQEASWAHNDHALHFGAGTSAVVAGVVAGVSAATNLVRVVTAIAGFAAAVLAGFQTFARAEERSRFHYRQSADLAGIALDGRILAERTPSEEELTALSGRLTKIRERVFGDESKPPE